MIRKFSISYRAQKLITVSSIAYNRHYPEPDEFNPHRHSLFLSDLFQYRMFLSSLFHYGSSMGGKNITAYNVHRIIIKNTTAQAIKM
jgi:hypothetical protein